MCHRSAVTPNCVSGICNVLRAVTLIGGVSIVSESLYGPQIDGLLCFGTELHAAPLACGASGV
jgi:hypothetical protein